MRGQPMTSEHYAPRLLKLLDYFNIIRYDRIDPLGGGRTCGPLWGDGQSLILSDTSQYEDYFNFRHSQPCSVKFDSNSLVFCHLDLAPRNMLLLGNAVICLLDWASAGFYPRVLEVCALRINWEPNDIIDAVLKDISLSKEEEDLSLLIAEAWGNNIKHP